MRLRMKKGRLAAIAAVMIAAIGYSACGESESGAAEEYECTCTLSIDCSAVWEHQDALPEELHEIIPADGMILKASPAGFHEGETAFDVVLRACRERKIVVEFNSTPMSGTSYIEGIQQLYEFDCGGLSGWKFAVNGEWPGIASSEYKLSDGDILLWYYEIDGVSEFQNP